MSDPFGLSRFTVTLEAAGAVHQLAQFQMSFALNGVPRATALLAVGRDARTGSDPAPIHKAADQLKYLTPAKVYFEATGIFSAAGEPWPAGRTLLFDGYVTGLSYRRAKDAVQLSLDLVHWLADLQFSSCASDVSHPSNPSSYTYRAATTLPGTGGSDEPTWLGQYAPSDYFTDANVGEDIWGAAFHPFFCALAEQDIYAVEGTQGDECFSRDGDSNRQALAALERIVGNGCGSTTSKYYKPLTLQKGPLGNELADSICTGVMATLGSSDYFQSFWDVITVKLGPQFGFSIVPQIDKAFAAPVVPGLQQTYHREILATDQEYVDLQSALTRPLRAVALFATAHDETQSGQAQATPGFDFGSGGCYAPAGDEEKKGQVLIMRAPPWLNDVSGSIEITGATSSVFTHSATTPGGGGPKAPKTPSTARKEAKTLATAYCHYLYVCEALRGRQGTVSGKFRLDIAPGTTVKIHGSPERFLGGEDVLGVDMIGLVHTVTCALDAEQQKAGTGFGLTHLRTVYENDQEKTSVPIHPMYAQAYTGAPLIDSHGMSGQLLSGAPTNDVSGIA